MCLCVHACILWRARIDEFSDLLAFDAWLLLNFPIILLLVLVAEKEGSFEVDLKVGESCQEESAKWMGQHRQTLACHIYLFIMKFVQLYRPVQSNRKEGSRHAGHESAECRQVYIRHVVWTPHQFDLKSGPNSVKNVQTLQLTSVSLMECVSP